jgi:hypothetical protein
MQPIAFIVYNRLLGRHPNVTYLPVTIYSIHLLRKSFFWDRIKQLELSNGRTGSYRL